MSDTLEQWEKEANDQYGQDDCCYKLSNRILTLIDLVRKKDEALKLYSGSKFWGCGCCTKFPMLYDDDVYPDGPHQAAAQALALTGTLK